VGDSEIGVIGFILDALDGLDSVVNIGKVDERAVFLLEEVDEFDVAVFAKVAFQLFLRERLKVFDVADVHVSRRTRVYSQSKLGRERAGVLSPSELQPTIVECQSLIGRGMEECKSRGRVDKRYKLMYKYGKSAAMPRAATKKRTAMCLSCMYRMLCSTPPLIELQRSSAVVSGWMLPR
jgi:hypothetical protein